MFFFLLFSIILLCVHSTRNRISYIDLFNSPPLFRLVQRWPCLKLYATQLTRAGSSENCPQAGNICMPIELLLLSIYINMFEISIDIKVDVGEFKSGQQDDLVPKSIHRIALWL